MKLLLSIVVFVNILNAAEKCPDLKGIFQCTSMSHPELNSILEFEQKEWSGYTVYYMTINNDGNSRVGYAANNQEYSFKQTKDGLPYSVRTKSFCQNDTFYFKAFAHATDESGVTVKNVESSRSIKRTGDRSIIFTVESIETENGVTTNFNAVLDCKEI